MNRYRGAALLAHEPDLSLLHRRQRSSVLSLPGGIALPPAMCGESRYPRAASATPEPSEHLDAEL